MTAKDMEKKGSIHYYVGALLQHQNYANPEARGLIAGRDQQLSSRHVTSKAKVDIRLLDGTIYKGCHSDRIKPFILRQDE